MKFKTIIRRKKPRYKLIRKCGILCVVAGKPKNQYKIVTNKLK